LVAHSVFPGYVAFLQQNIYRTKMAKESSSWPQLDGPLPVSGASGRSRHISAGYLSRPSHPRAKPHKQLLAMLVATVAIVLTFGRGMAPRCAVA
jgi:hypothetical protein